MKKLLILSLLLTSCFNSDYKIEKPTNKKFHPIIQILGIQNKTEFHELNFPMGSCTAFVINDTTAVTAGHCLNITTHELEYRLLTIVKEAKLELMQLKAELFKVRKLCVGFQCVVHEIEILGRILSIKRELAISKVAKADRFKVLTLDGSNTKIVATAQYANERRDYGFVKGDFKKFNKLHIAPGFPVKPNNMLQSCGYAGLNSPPVCIDFIAIGKSTFDYAGLSMLVPGMSGGPVIDKDGRVVGINSSSPGKFAIMVPMLGVVQLKEK